MYELLTPGPVTKALGQLPVPAHQAALQFQQRRLIFHVSLWSAPLDEVRSLAHQIRYRREIGRRLVRSAGLLNAIIAAEPIPGIDIPLLLASQVRMVLRIAATYGESLSVRHARELLTTMAGGVALRYLAAELGKLVPGPGWLIGAAVTGLGTLAIGRVAVAYFESGKRLTPEQLRRRYRWLMRRPRSGLEDAPVDEGNG